ncbi:S-adenosyl-L-methionine-dependent methyltransferase [Polychaeton citri CBS 116435]|uniref:S-adenosyl-L-methionine-dependent methyltransferase n=1 Tax=Polychaeton citri CBS 116435 TaxID=1314669 RepID=A0A9P4QDY7_9PEZI|nr:S-adenosyl-L-methionine-dependent methyltransferase [Polychaeton citri CBS 116435]
MAQKRAFNEGKRHFKKNKKQKTSDIPQGSNEEVLLADVRRLLQNTKSRVADTEEQKALPEQHAELDLEINELSSTGDGLAQKDGQIYVVPFAAPGDIVKARVYKHDTDEHYSLADFLSVEKASEHRTEEPKCKYFTQCSGCQFQHLPYTFQLAHKRSVVAKAYRNFSNLAPELVPEVGETMGSPLQYGYRTKLTPHFDAPPGARRANRKGEKVKWDKVPEIGYMKKGTQKTMDIEDCPIGTEAVRKGLIKERDRVSKNIDQYARGATLLLRESTERLENEQDNKAVATEDAVLEDRGKWIHRKTCITNHKATSTEYIEDFRFDNPAGSFFQNNNSILPLVTQYIRDHIKGPELLEEGMPTIKYMIDAYCGSGFFTVTLSSMFERSIGIDISSQSIDFASRNAELNGLPQDSTNFLAADANKLFDTDTLDHNRFPHAQTVVVIDPPRKGCDANFIRQLLEYGPQRVCYVSCNVHTQARDVGWLVNGVDGVVDDKGQQGSRTEGLYEIESLRGFDFFPQTGHVEGVAFLRRKSS